MRTQSRWRMCANTVLIVLPSFQLDLSLDFDWSILTQGYAFHQNPLIVAPDV